MITNVLVFLIIVYAIVFIPASIAGMFLVVREQRKMLRQLRHTMNIFFPAAKSWEVDKGVSMGTNSKVEIKKMWDEDKDGTA